MLFLLLAAIVFEITSDLVIFGLIGSGQGDNKCLCIKLALRVLFIKNGRRTFTNIHYCVGRDSDQSFDCCGGGS